MLRNYLKIAFRNLLKDKAYSLINILGLAVGMALCILIIAFIRDETGFDTFHEFSQRIYRLGQVEEHNHSDIPVVRIGPAAAHLLAENFPEAIERAAFFDLITWQRDFWVRVGKNRFKEKRIGVTEPSFLEIFSFNLLRGNARNALEKPFSVILTESTARKYFQSLDVLGKEISPDLPGEWNFRVTGVAADPPASSHIQFDILFSISTFEERFGADYVTFLKGIDGNQFYNYILLREGYPVEKLEKQLPAFLNRVRPPQSFQSINIKSFFLQPLTQIHLHAADDPYTETEPGEVGRISTLYILSAAGFLILLIACINFMNLATARFSGRAREVGLRKVLGARRGQLIQQFFGESVLITLIALPIALLLCLLGLPVFNAMTGKSLVIGFGSDPFITWSVTGLVLFVGLVSGIYPAFFLTSFRPIDIFKGKLWPGKRSGFLRKALVTTQFTLSIGLVTAALIILQQLDFMSTRALGFDRENLLVMSFNFGDPAKNRQNISNLVEKYKQHPAIVNATSTALVPGDIRLLTKIEMEDNNAKTNSSNSNDFPLIALALVGPNIIPTLGIGMKEGQDFPAMTEEEWKDAIIINEKSIEKFGLRSPVLGKKIRIHNVGTKIVRGIMNDVHWEPKRREIFAMGFVCNPQINLRLLVRMKPGKETEALQYIKEEFRRLEPDRQCDYFFLASRIDDLYRVEKRLSDVVQFFTLMAIFTACLGLYGLASYTTGLRAGEIAVRKVLGASVTRLLGMIAWEYAKLIIIAVVIAEPIVYSLMNRWLSPDRFYYHIAIGVEPFVQAAAVVACVAMVSIGYRSIRAALANPVEGIKYQ